MRLSSKGRKRNKRRVPEINTTSTADISFMLLIFFLVTTSMDHDKGLKRQLPPPESQKEVLMTDVDKNNVLTLAITADNKYMMNDTIASLSKIHDEAGMFIKRVGENHIIQLLADRNGDYESYFKLQNMLVNLYSELRDEAAQAKFKKPFMECTDVQRDTIRVHLPQRISEEFSKLASNDVDNTEETIGEKMAEKGGKQ